MTICAIASATYLNCHRHAHVHAFRLRAALVAQYVCKHVGWGWLEQPARTCRQLVRVSGCAAHPVLVCKYVCHFGLLWPLACNSRLRPGPGKSACFTFPPACSAMSTSATVRWASGVAQAAARASTKAQEASAAAQEAAQEAEQAAQEAAALVEKLMAVEGAEAAVQQPSSRADDMALV